MGNFFGNLSAKLQEFMIGRNGPDKLSRWALGGAIIATLIGMFIPNVILTMVSYALLFYSIYRIFSTNVAARREEDEKFANFLARFKGGKGGSTGGGTSTAGTGNGTAGTGTGKGSQSTSSSTTGTGTSTGASTTAGKAAASPTQAKVHFTCDNCGQQLSVPKGRGKLKATCPTCHHQQTIDS